MTTITTSEIKDRLEESFTNVNTLSKVSPDTIFNSTHARTATVLTVKGLELMIGCYTYSNDIENGDYKRYLYIPALKLSFHF